MRIDEQDKVVDSRDNHLDDDPTLCGQSLHKTGRSTQFYLCIKSERTDLEQLAISQHYLAI